MEESKIGVTSGKHVFVQTGNVWQMCFYLNDYVYWFVSVKDQKHFQWAQSYFPEKKKKPNKNKEQHQLLGRTCWEDNMVSERSCSGHAINYWWAPAQPQLWQLLHLAQQTACSAHGAHCLHPEPLHNQFCMHCTSQAISELRSEPCQTMKCRHLGKMCGQGQFDIPLA